MQRSDSYTDVLKLYNYQYIDTVTYIANGTRHWLYVMYITKSLNHTAFLYRLYHDDEEV